MTLMRIFIFRYKDEKIQRRQLNTALLHEHVINLSTMLLDYYILLSFPWGFGYPYHIQLYTTLWFIAKDKYIL